MARDVKIVMAVGHWVPGLIYGEDARAAAKELGFEITLADPTIKRDAADWAKEFIDADAIITGWGAPSLNAQSLAGNTKLRIVGHAAGSVAGLVSDDLYARGVRVVTSNRMMARCVAEWCLLTTLIGARQMLNYSQFGEGGSLRWDNRLQMKGIADSVVSIWGLGEISRILIELLRPFAPKRVLLHSSHMSAAEAAELGVERCGFDEMFDADVVHLLGAMTEANRGRVGAEQLARMKDGSTLINGGRAHLADQDALMAELKRGRIFGIFDVYAKEPPPMDDPLRSMPNVILTPHNAGEGRTGRFVRLVLEEFARFFDGKPLEHEVTQGRAAMMTNGKLVSQLAAKSK